MAAINVPRLLDDLVDVAVASPDAGDALVWVASNNRWEAVAAGIGLGVDVVDMANNQFLVRGTSDPATDVTGLARQAIIRIKTDGGGSKASLEYLVERVYYSDEIVLPRRVSGSTTNSVTLFTDATHTNIFEPSTKLVMAGDYGQGNDPNHPGRVTVYSAGTSTPNVVIQAAASQTAPMMSFRASDGVPKTEICSQGSLCLATLSDALAPNASLFFGSDHLDGAGAPRLCRKSAAGVVTVIG